MREAIKREVERYRRFRRGVMGREDEDAKAAGVDAKRYAKFVLREDTTYEKRELLMHLRSRLVVQDKTLRLE
jgi:hypothetical protein